MRRFLATTAMLIGLAVPANAQQAMSADSIRLALKWVEANTDYRDIPPPHHWMELSHANMQQFANRGAGARLMSNVNALYMCESQTLVLLSTYADGRKVDWSRYLVRSTVVHELTHHAQCVTGKWGGNACAREREAYAVQAKYLREKERVVTEASDKAFLAERASHLEKIATGEVAAGDGCGKYLDGG